MSFIYWLNGLSVRSGMAYTRIYIQIYLIFACKHIMHAPIHTRAHTRTYIQTCVGM